MADDFFDRDEKDIWTFIKPSPDQKSLNTHWATIHLDMEFGYVKFLQKWHYVWITANGATPLTNQEKIDFHYRVESEIWTDWNSHRPLPGGNTDPTLIAINKLLNAHTGIILKVSGTSPFAQKFASTGIAVEFDVLVVTKHPHWTVKVHTMPAGQSFRSHVDVAPRTIHLDSQSVLPSQVCNNATPQVCRPGFITPSHEFGHTIGNIVELNKGDEYVRTSRFLGDTDSIMNIGREVRARHFWWIVQELNRLVPATRFALPP